MGFSFANIERYATSSLKWRNVRTCMTSFSAKNLSRLKVYIIKRKFIFLEWICYLFHLVKRENVYFIRGFATHEICIFHFTRWNKWHIHSKNLNILYLCKFSRICFFVCFLIFLKFSPKCRTKKLGMIYTTLGSFWFGKELIISP